MFLILMEESDGCCFFLVEKEAEERDLAVKHFEIKLVNGSWPECSFNPNGRICSVFLFS